MSETLLRWLDNPSPTAGVHFADSRDGWDHWSYPRLAALVDTVAKGLLAHGVGSGDGVVLVLRGGVEFVATLYGCLAAGAVASPVAPPASFSDRATYGDHMANVLDTSKPVLVITEDDLVDVLSVGALDTVAPTVISYRDLTAAAGGTTAARTANARPEQALLTYTSGSSGHCRGVRVPYTALESNVAAIVHTMDGATDGGAATWLPPHHDMGLIGTLVVSISTQMDVRVMSPMQFVRSPLRYLRSLAHDGMAYGASPTFGLDYIVRKVRPEDIADLDFSRVRTLYVGAERVDADVLRRFLALVGPRGFPRRALTPSYGCAEATLAVTALPADEEWSSVRVDPACLAAGRRVALVGPGEPGVELVGCGRAVPGMSVSVVADDRITALPEGVVGEIVATGTSVADGYAGHANTAGTHFADGRLHTRDAGFLLDGQLYVLGRLGDSLKLRGRTLFAEDVEAVLVGAGVPANRCTALLGVREGRATVAVLLEQVGQDTVGDVAAALRARVEDADLLLLQVRPGAVARTSSGKPKRRQLWRTFTEGGLAAVEIPQADIELPAG
jgi:acyl-CoA synthetase (AMP-forming)/AMP-acid ligase II